MTETTLAINNQYLRTKFKNSLNAPLTQNHLPLDLQTKTEIKTEGETKAITRLVDLSSKRMAKRPLDHKPLQQKI